MSMYALMVNKPQLADAIEKNIAAILKLNDDTLDIYWSAPFKQLQKAQQKAQREAETEEECSILESLTEEDLFSIINALKTAVAFASEDVKIYKEEIRELTQQNLEGQRDLAKDAIDRNSNEQDEALRQLKNPMPAEPGSWVRFLADEQPGFLKSIFLWFVPEQSISDAKTECTTYDDAVNDREALTAKIERLETTIDKLETQLSEFKAKIASRDSMQRETTELSVESNKLQRAVSALEKNAKKAFPETKEQIRKPEVSKDNDDELQFSMDL